MKCTTRRIAAAVALVVALALSACGGDSDPGKGFTAVTREDSAVSPVGE